MLTTNENKLATLHDLGVVKNKLLKLIDDIGGGSETPIEITKTYNYTGTGKYTLTKHKLYDGGSSAQSVWFGAFTLPVPSDIDLTSVIDIKYDNIAHERQGYNGATLMWNIVSDFFGNPKSISVCVITYEYESFYQQSHDFTFVCKQQ